MAGSIISWQEIASNTSMRRPHIVILGAGASLAAFPNGDRNGLRLPLMLDLVETIGLQGELQRAGVEYEERDFEQVYSELDKDPALSTVRSEVERRVAEYFSRLELPEHPTLYDYLVLSLRRKDAIATFNWDPFLFAACERNHNKTQLPQLFFLHGCALIGYCPRHKQQGRLGSLCGVCGRVYAPTRLLYPVRNKDYVSHPYIASQWRSLRHALKAAYVLTIFGYGAPKTDAAAIDMMSEAWGAPADRNLEEIEIIDIKTEEELAATWSKFIHSHHRRVTDSYFESILAHFPRRSCEAIFQQSQEIGYLDVCELPKFTDLSDMWRWFGDLQEYERGGA